MQERLSSISCPVCGNTFYASEGKTRTLGQWRFALLVHLIASPKHHMEARKAESIIDKYLASI